MKVLITGASGRVGTILSDYLHRHGFELRLTDRKIRRSAPVRTDVVNLLDRDGVYRLLDGCDAIVHLGNHPYFHHGADAQQIYTENSAMNMNVFQAGIEHGVKKIVFFSSIQVISGDRHLLDNEAETPPSMLKYLPIDSDTPPNARNPYSVSKLVGEVLLQNYVAPRGISCIAIRLPWTAHPDSWTHLKSMRGRRLRPHTMLDEAFIYLHSEDAAALVAATLRTDLPGYRLYHPGALTPMHGIPVPELIERFYRNVPLRKPVSEMSSLVDISRITRETGWVPKHAVEPIEPLPMSVAAAG